MKNTKLVINIQELVSESWSVGKLSNMIKISYLTKGRGNNPKPVIIPSKIIVNERFVEAVAMYIGDGKLSDDKRHLDFTSKDRDGSFYERFL
ncbi:MAG: hypothetical protein ABIG93_02120 [archaeon]|nr:hypothetical protein [Nanoarchaeota archaeon]